MNNNSAYYDLALRIEDNFAEIESDITVNFRENDDEYAALFQKISALKAEHPIIGKSLRATVKLSFPQKNTKQ